MHKPKLLCLFLPFPSFLTILLFRVLTTWCHNILKPRNEQELYVRTHKIWQWIWLCAMCEHKWFKYIYFEGLLIKWRGSMKIIFFIKFERKVKSELCRWWTSITQSCGFLTIGLQKSRRQWNIMWYTISEIDDLCIVLQGSLKVLTMYMP
jgi:hypothetical protein